MSSDQKRAFLAVALSGLVLVLWSVFFSPEKSSVQKRQGRKVEEGPPPLPLPLSLPPQPSAGQQVTLRSSGHEITLDSNLSIVDFHNPNERFTFKQTLGEKSQVSFLLKDSQGKRVFPSFELTEVKETSFRGKDENLGLEVLGEMDELGRVFLSLLSKNLTRFSLLVNTWPKEVEGGRTRELISYAEKVERLDLEEKEPLQGQFSWVGVDFNYHLFGMLFGAEGTKVFASIERTSKGPFFVDLVHPVNKMDVTLVYTKKSYNYLKSLGKSLQQSVDFGFFGVLAVYILRGLQFIYQYFPNYGVAIIILTFLIRLLLFPLQYKSIKSMKKMQVIQPEMNKIREKYKEHPQELQKRTMELFKRSGANPLGGCFPLLLQMPVFFAFYQVLYHAVELVNAPFIFWIKDLSIKDPFYVLPLLMGATFFIQTKLSPSPSPDPTQKKIMMFMPLVFTFIMKDLPAGLNLYFTVSTLFGIGQQFFVYRYVK